MTEVIRYGLEKIVELTNQRQFAMKRNVYRETLRQLIAIFGNVYYQDANGNLIKVKCTTGKQDRITGKDFAENNLVLPYITIVEKGTSEPEGRKRNDNILVNEVIWDEKEKRAKRIVSVAPKAVNIDYQINIWAKFNSDLDQIRYGILSLFNPALSVRTNYSDFTKAFIKEESDIIDQKSEDTSDRLVQKTISITVETYLPSPKFLFTNTGEIQSFNFDVNLQTGETEQTILRPPEYLPEGSQTEGGGGGGITGPLTLSGSLDDVQIIDVALGQVLVWNGSYWTASSVAGVGGGNGTFNHQELNNRLVNDAHPQYVLSSTNLTLSSNVSAHIASASVHFTSGSLSGAYVLTSTNSNLSSLVSNLQTSTASISSVVNSHIASASVHFTSGSLSGAYVLTSTNSSLSSLVNNHIGSAVHWELSTLNQNYINASGDSANAGFYLSSVSATNISATNYYNLPSATIVWEAARDIVLLVRNGYASRTILKGDPVTVVSGTGNSGGIPIVEILSSVNTHVPDADLLSNHVAGLAREDILAGAEGYIIIEGLLTGLNTNNFLVGDWLYVSSNGQLNNQRPTPPYESHPVGVVTRSQPNNGTILVKIENSPELNDIVGFNLNPTLINGDIITYDLDTSTFINKQTVNVSGLGKFGSVSATSVSSIHLSSIYVSANTIVTNKLAVGGSDGYIYNPDGDLYISATNGKVKFNTGFEVTGTISGTSISATTYLNLPSGTAIWNANQLQSRNVATNNPANGDALVWNGSQWEPSAVSTGGGSVTNNPGGSNGDIQFKNGASFSGVASVNYDSATDRLNVTNLSAVNLSATNFTNPKLDNHIASASVHFTSGSLSGAYVLTSTNSNLSSLVNNLQVSTASISSVVSNHIASSDVHFTSGSLSGAYVLTSTNSSLSSLVNNLQVSTASISSVVSNHIASSNVHFTSGSLSGAYVLTSTNSNLSSLVNNLQTSTASISSVVQSHIASADVHFTSGSLSAYYAASAWTDNRYVLSSTNTNLSSLVNNLQTSAQTISSTLASHIASSDVHFTSGSLSGAYVLTGTNLSLSTLVSNLQSSAASISSVVNAHLASAVHWELSTLNTNYINASGDSASAAFYFSSLRSTSFSSTVTSSVKVYPASAPRRHWIYFGDPNDGSLTQASGGDLWFSGTARIGTSLTPSATLFTQRIALAGTDIKTGIVFGGFSSNPGLAPGDLREYDPPEFIPLSSIKNGIAFIDTSGELSHSQEVYITTDQNLYDTINAYQFIAPYVSSQYLTIDNLIVASSISATNFSGISLSGSLRDVEITNPTNDYVLTWSATAGKWVPKAAPGGGGGISNGFAIIQDEAANPLAATGEDTVRFVSRDNAILISVDSGTTPQEVNFEVDESAVVHNSLFGLTTGNPHTQYATLSGAVFTGQVTAPSVSATSGIFTNLSVTTLSATTYQNLPSGTATWNANKIQGTDVTSTAPTTNQALVYDGAKWMPSSLAAPVVPGGSNTEIQFNNNGVFSGVSQLVWNSTAQDLEVAAISATTISATDKWNTIYKLANETKTANTTFADDSTLWVDMAASKAYAVRANVMFSSTTAGDIKFNVTGTQAATQAIFNRRTIIGNATSYGNIGVITGYFTLNLGQTGNGNGMLHIEGFVNNGGTASRFSIQWAQQASDAGGTTVFGGSYLEYRQLN